ncbi:integral membrane protein [Fusarium heterosporum]|uniref:Integral membrane protein n=1 Tax=Fusarium heterosporum TaxID=42747 RepID=A0A8H5WJW0_FUSHE|nr:integral membrane protein [Fusarium heterosporum]
MIRVKLLCILVTLCLLCGAAGAQSLSSVLVESPKCAVDCLLGLLSDQAFEGKDQSMLCEDKKFAQAIGNCLTDKCTMRQTMSMDERRYRFCGMKPTDLRAEFWIGTIIMATLASIFFACRMVAKVVLSLPWGVDDSLTVLSMAFMMTFFVILQILITVALGGEMWYLSDYQVTTGLQASNDSHVLFFFLEIFYIVTLAIIKSAILCFFLRIFPDDKFRVMAKCTLVFNALIGIIFFILTFFQTHPLTLFWEGWQKKAARRHIVDGTTRLTIPHGGLNLLLDIWMIVLPLTQLWEVGLKLKKKLGVIAMFSVGILLDSNQRAKVHDLVKY